MDAVVEPSRPICALLTGQECVHGAAPWGRIVASRCRNGLIACLLMLGRKVMIYMHLTWHRYFSHVLRTGP